MTFSPHQDDQVLLLAFPQEDFNPLIRIPEPDSFIKSRQLPVVDIAAPWVISRSASPLLAGCAFFGFE